MLARFKNADAFEEIVKNTLTGDENRTRALNIIKFVFSEWAQSFDKREDIEKAFSITDENEQFRITFFSINVPLRLSLVEGIFKRALFYINDFNIQLCTLGKEGLQFILVISKKEKESSSESEEIHYLLNKIKYTCDQAVFDVFEKQDKLLISDLVKLSSLAHADMRYLNIQAEASQNDYIIHISGFDICDFVFYNRLQRLLLEKINTITIEEDKNYFDKRMVSQEMTRAIKLTFRLCKSSSVSPYLMLPVAYSEPSNTKNANGRRPMVHSYHNDPQESDIEVKRQKV